MQSLRRAHENRAAFLGVVADRDDVIEPLTVELIHMLRAMAAYVDAQLTHGGYRFRPHSAGLRAGALDLELIAGIMPQQPFGHLAPCGIAGAEDQDTLFHALPRSGTGNQWRVRLQAAQTDSMTGTSTKTPTTVASAAPDSGPNSAMAVATASSKKLEAPISAPGAATECSIFSHFIRPLARPALK